MLRKSSYPFAFVSWFDLMKSCFYMERIIDRRISSKPPANRTRLRLLECNAKSLLKYFSFFTVKLFFPHYHLGFGFQFESISWNPLHMLRVRRHDSSPSPTRRHSCFLYALCQVLSRCSILHLIARIALNVLYTTKFKVQFSFKIFSVIKLPNIKLV